MKKVIIFNFYKTHTMLKNHKASACQQRHTTCAPNSANYDQLPISIVKTIKYIETHFTEEVSLYEVAERACLSPNHFSRLFKQEMNMTFQNYRDKVRIDEAKRRLEYGNDKIKDIAYDCGYSSLPNFRRAFKADCKMTPKEYRRKYRTK